MISLLFLYSRHYLCSLGGWEWKWRKGVETRSILPQRRKKKRGGTLISSNNKLTLPPCLSKVPLYQVFKIQSSLSLTANSLLYYTSIFWYPVSARFTTQKGTSHLEKSIIKRLLWESPAWATRWVSGLISFTGRVAQVSLLTQATAFLTHTESHTE